VGRNCGELKTTRDCGEVFDPNTNWDINREVYSKTRESRALEETIHAHSASKEITGGDIAIRL
jgi:hypothetical protein